ncbi:hypothetical protein BGZ81_001724 [Podila clonocystis]|nr:hypothetical protein BGZ81_001724 [Podila clonocystis]
MTRKKVAIVTGANTGVGYAIVERLVEESNEPLIVVLACRNKQRAHQALASLETHFNKQLRYHHQQQPAHTKENHPVKKYHHPELKVELVDVGSAASVTKFNERIREQYTTIDFLFCNAGVLPSAGIKWSKLMTDLFVRPMDLVIRSDVLVQPKQHLTEDGVGNVLAANVFGHYLMIKGLEDQLSKTEEDPGRVIWTSSMTAEKSSFDPSDWQGLESAAPYESSKWVTDLLAIRLNEIWASGTSLSRAESPASITEDNGQSITRRVTRSTSKAALDSASSSKRHIMSISTQPGVVASGIGGLAHWIVMLRIALHYFVRICGEKNQTITGFHGAHPNAYVALAPNPRTTLDYHNKYGSQVGRFGKEILKVETIVEYDRGQAEVVVDELEKLRVKLGQE